MRKKIEIDGYELIVSDDGRVWTPDRTIYRSDGVEVHYKEHQLIPSLNNSGYMKVYSHKPYLVHRLVAYAFIPNPHNYLQVNHKDGDKSNNMKDNLEWCDQSYNMHHAYDNKLYKGKIGAPSKKVMCVETQQIYQSLIEASQSMKISKSHISRSCNHGLCVKGYHFKFI